MQQNKNLAKIRMEQAERCLKSAKTLLADEDCKDAANRSYYCVFHSIRSVLALDGVDFKSHSAIIAYFRKEYIKTKIIDISLSTIISDIFQARTDSDYEDYYVISKSKVEEQIENAEFFLRQIEVYLKNAV